MIDPCDEAFKVRANMGWDLDSQQSRRIGCTARGTSYGRSAGITLEHVVACHQVDGTVGIYLFNTIDHRHKVRTRQPMDFGK